jgi:hypothetical protein
MEIISYKHLRRLIGFLAFLLPIGCLFGGLAFSGLPIQSSISYYYHTPMQDLLVGILVGVGFFLISYYGYDFQDRLVNSLSGITAMLIAFNPCLGPQDPVGMFQIPAQVSNIIHLISAGSFFFLLAYNSYFLFTKPEGLTLTLNKIKRNTLYRVVGIIIISCMVLLGILNIFFAPLLNVLPLVFTLETIMLFSFGVSWLVKGETIWADKV